MVVQCYLSHGFDPIWRGDGCMQIKGWQARCMRLWVESMADLALWRLCPSIIWQVFFSLLHESLFSLIVKTWVPHSLKVVDIEAWDKIWRCTVNVGSKYWHLCHLIWWVLMGLMIFGYRTDPWPSINCVLFMQSQVSLSSGGNIWPILLRMQSIALQKCMLTTFWNTLGTFCLPL
jgi:hypothetical protein